MTGTANLIKYLSDNNVQFIATCRRFRRGIWPLPLTRQKISLQNLCSLKQVRSNGWR
jgi:hypothetical protein